VENLEGTSHNGSELADVPESEQDAAVIEGEEAIFRLRLAEAKIYRSHLQSLRNSWYLFAALSWLLTLGALFLALLPYLNVRLTFTVPEVVSYVSAFVVVLATAFALVSSYRVVITTGMVVRSTFYIERALAVARTFGVQLETGLSDG
jgi:hypothetical protein